MKWNKIILAAKNYLAAKIILFVVYPLPATGSWSPGLPVQAVERDWLMRDRDWCHHVTTATVYILNTEQ